MPGGKRKGASPTAEKASKKQRVIRESKSTLHHAAEDADDDSRGFEAEDGSAEPVYPVPSERTRVGSAPTKFKLDTSSAEAHAKQRELARERKASKPSADAIQRSKKLWERLRLKSHVPTDERRQLVAELFSIIDGRVHDFVFKHDSVRVVQCALKYAKQEQRRTIAKELRGDVRPLVESKYGKFLVAKMVVEGDQGIRNVIIPEFYGHIKRLINHPEASWIVDDIYRQIATPQQKSIMLREWYGPEFALFRREGTAGETADLVAVLEMGPEKRKPILRHLLQMINALIQKKMTGFTMLHDAMLQYLNALSPGSEEHAEFFEILKGDIETDVEKKQDGGSVVGGDLFRNLAFTKSGSRLVCLALAYGSAKDRKIILRCFRDTVEMMAFDPYAKLVLMVGLDVTDDTKMSSKAVLFELLGPSIADETQRLDRLEGIVTHLHARVPILYPLASMARWLVSDTDKGLLEEVHKVRETSSKKAPEQRRRELLDYLSEPLLELVSKRATSLVQNSFGCQCITETLLDTVLEANTASRDQAKKVVAELAAGDPTNEAHVAKNAAAGRMLKTLVFGGNFNPETKSTHLEDPRLEFAAALFPVIKDNLSEWACSDSSLVVVALLESEDVADSIKKEVKAVLQKGMLKLETAARGQKGDRENAEGKTQRNQGVGKGNAGSRVLLAKLGAGVC